MATRTVELTEQQMSFVEEKVKSGRYADANAVIEDGLRLIEAIEEDEREELEWMREAIAEGEADFERGDFVTLKTAEDLTSFIQQVRAEVNAELKAEARRA